MFGTGKYKKSSIKVNVDELNENEGLSKIDTNTVSDDTLTIFILDVRDVRSWGKHIHDIVHDCRNLRNVICRTHMKPLDSGSIIDETWKDFDLNFDNKDNKFLSLVYRCQGDIAFIKKLNIDCPSIISLRRDSFLDRVFTLMLVYWKKAISLDELRILKYLVAENVVDVIVGDFNYGLSKVLWNKLQGHTIVYTQLSMNQHIYLNSK